MSPAGGRVGGRGGTLQTARGILAATLESTGGALVVLVVLASLVFLALRLLPGDPAALVLGDQAPEQARVELRERLGLNHPLIVQYAYFLAGLVRLDLGDSLARPGTSAVSEVVRALGPTAGLAGLAVALGALGGILAAVLVVGPWLGRFREALHAMVLAVAAAPLLAFAPLLTYIFAVRLRWVPLPGDPESGALGLLFGAGLLSLPLGAQVARIARASLLDLGRAKFLEVAVAKGGGPFRVWMVHALPAASAPIAVVIAAQLGALLGGAVVLERMFERPGLGTLMLNAYASRDLPVLEAAIVAAGMLFVLAQALAAAVAAALDPRGRA